MPKRRTKQRRRVSRVKRARVTEEFNARNYFLSMPLAQPKPAAPEADFDARDYFLNGGGGE
jgi:hypothetical protein